MAPPTKAKGSLLLGIAVVGFGVSFYIGYYHYIKPWQARNRMREAELCADVLMPKE